MISEKHGDRAAVFLITAAFVFVMLFSMFGVNEYSADTTGGIKMEYEDKLFKTGENIKINIIIDSSDWQEMLDNAISEEYCKCDAEINGSTFSNIAIRPKGNTSLSSVVSDPDSDRYSFKIEFDHYDNEQTCYGLDKLVLNNNFADATNMKEAVVYDLFGYLGAVSPLANFAEISVNGEYLGIYLAIEAVEESFLLRNYGAGYGELYKPETMEMGGGQGGGMPDMGGIAPPDMNNNSDSSEQSAFGGGMPPDMNKNSDGSEQPAFGGGMNSGGSDLNYTDDSADSYSSIWEGEVTKTDDSDHKRVIEALKNISEGTDIEKYLNVDNVLKYMAAHTFAVNMDSFTGNMAHNYYLYEKDGMLDIIPWDYNLSFGGMNGGDAESVINFPIDTPFSCTDFFDALLENEEYLEKYHEYLQLLCEKYMESGEFDVNFYETKSRISEAVKNDPTAFYSYEEFEAAAGMLYKTVILRSESILGQLSGTIPSTEEGQKQNSNSLIDSSEIDLSVMGTMNHGNENKGNGGGDFRNGGRFMGNDRQAFSPSENVPQKVTSENVIILCICGGVALIGILFGTLYKRR